MAKSPNQKLKLLYLYQILLQRTDEEHPITVPQLIGELDLRGIRAERKSVYDDLEALRLFGLDVQSRKGRSPGWFVGRREFELPELKLLVDSVQSSKFITYKKTLALIRKIESLASVYEAQLLSRQVYVKNRIKTMNESIYYNVDEIHTGIARDRRIRFRYFDYTVSKERRFRRDGGYYVVSPFALTWDDENYYLVAYDSEAGIIKHFRVDKMLDIGILDEARDGQESFAALDMAEYAKKVFGMFSGREERVRMRFDNQLVGAVLDRLGREAMLIPDGESCFTVTAQVEVSPQFFAWISGFGSLARIMGPDHVVQAMRAHAAEVLAMYE
mgnify:CR=1 FL=1